MKRILLLIVCTILLSNVYSQENDFFSLLRDGKKHKKTTVYLLYRTNEENKKIPNKDNIEFYISAERFFCNKHNYSIDTISYTDFTKLKITDIKDLKSLEYSVYKKALEEEKINIPQPPNHNILNVYILEPSDSCKFIKYRVNWVFSTH